MTTRVAGLGNTKAEPFFDRHAWKILLGVSLIMAFSE
jgi:hypothetical protein